MSGFGRNVRVLVSYAHDQGIAGHRDRALELAESLRLRGVDARIDQYVETDPPYWPQWMIEQVRDADFVLCLASPAYRERCEGRGDDQIGRGARWEGVIITEEMYARQSVAHKKFISVLLEQCSSTDIPDVLRPVGTTHYRWPDQDEDLYRRLTNQPRVVPTPLGEIVQLPIRRETEMPRFEGVLRSVAITGQSEDQLEVFAVTADGRLEHRWFPDDESDDWSAWFPMEAPGEVVSIAGVSRRTGAQELVIGLADGRVMHRWYFSNTGWLDDWAEMPRLEGGG